MSRKVGRPQKTIANTFPANWKDIIIDLSSKGFSEAEIRVELCKSGKKFRQGLWYSLQERETEFSEAIQTCKVLRQAWWEQQARKSLKSRNFQTGLWYACMKNMFGYRDKHEVEGTLNLSAESILKAFTDAERMSQNRLANVK